jgi:ribonuclease D
VVLVVDDGAPQNLCRNEETQKIMLINHSETLTALCARLKTANAPISIDTEFISEKRYYAKLCLVQVGCEAPSGNLEALVDPFAVDLAPLLELVSDENIVKIVHAGGQDLQIFFSNYGCTARNVFDTQIAAAFLGYGHQAGLADLVRRVIDGPQLSKKLQFTDWAARPLSEEQMQYALDDIRFLPALYKNLSTQLEQRGRMAWAETEFRRAEKKASTTVSSEDLFRKLNLAGMNRRNLATLRELAAARDALAREIDKPASFIVPDLSLLQIAKHPPSSAAELRSTRGMPGVSEKQSRAILEAVERAAALSNDDLPQRNSGERPDPQLDAVAGLLNVVSQARAADHDISRTYLAPRDDMFTLAAWWLRRDGSEPPELPLLQDWRRELLGQELLDLLSGRLLLALDNTPNQPAVKVVSK